MITSIGPTIGSSVAGALRSAAVALNRPTSSFVMYALSAQGRGGMSSTAIRCWRFAVRSITAPLTGYLNVINSVCKKRKNHRMLLFANSICAFFATTSFSHTPTYVGCIVECGLLTACRVRHITSSSSWHPTSVDAEHGAKLPQNPASMGVSGHTGR